MTKILRATAVLFPFIQSLKEYEVGEFLVSTLELANFWQCWHCMTISGQHESLESLQVVETKMQPLPTPTKDPTRVIFLDIDAWFCGRCC